MLAPLLTDHTGVTSRALTDPCTHCQPCCQWRGPKTFCFDLQAQKNKIETKNSLTSYHLLSWNRALTLTFWWGVPFCEATSVIWVSLFSPSRTGFAASSVSVHGTSSCLSVRFSQGLCSPSKPCPGTFLSGYHTLVSESRDFNGQSCSVSHFYHRLWHRGESLAKVHRGAPPSIRGGCTQLEGLNWGNSTWVFFSFFFFKDRVSVAQASLEPLVILLPQAA